MIASFHKHDAIVKILIDAGADVEARCNENNTALMKAAWAGAPDSVRYLLQAGADVDATEVEGMTALMIASFHGHREVVEQLLEGGASVNHCDFDGYTALANATEQGHADIAQLLERYGGRTSSGLVEVSMNFDLRDVLPFLSDVARHIESGFTKDDARRLANEISALNHDDERSWRFRVSCQGREIPMRVDVFMDDIDSPDVAVFTQAPLASLVDRELETYLHG